MLGASTDRSAALEIPLTHPWHAWLTNASARHSRFCGPLLRSYATVPNPVALKELRARLDVDAGRVVDTFAYTVPVS